MARLRIGGAAAGSPPSLPRIRVGGVAVTGATLTTPRIRVGGVVASGATAVILAPLPPQTVEPSSTVTLTAVPAIGAAVPDSYTWRVVSGAPVSFVGTGASVTFVAPWHWQGIYTIVGVRASAGGVQSIEQTVRIDSLEQLDGILTPTGWTAAPRAALI